LVLLLTSPLLELVQVAFFYDYRLTAFKNNSQVIRTVLQTTNIAINSNV